jgi:uncharacterized protein (TIGR02186 family)
MNRPIRGALMLVLLCGAAICCAQPGIGTDQVAIELNPDHIDVGTFYDGATIHVSADLPACEDAVVVLEGTEEEFTLNRKGRVAGIWLNVTQVTVSNAPDVYVLAASDELDRICTPDEQRALGLGLGFLRDRINFACDRAHTGSEFDEFLQLKRDRGTYELDAPLSLTQEGPNRVKLSAMLSIAATVEPGSYDIRLYAFNDKRMISSGTTRLTIRHVGLADWLASLSRGHGAVYGSVAIIVAILVGIIMGIIFHLLPRPGH